MPNLLIKNNVYQGTATPDTPIIADPSYEPRAVFSINASNQLQGTFWITKNGVRMNTNIGTASFEIYDQDGVSIGISQSGIVADVNSTYIITPVLATLIQDLTHYVVKITITADSASRVGFVGITLGE